MIRDEMIEMVILKQAFIYNTFNSIREYKDNTRKYNKVVDELRERFTAKSFWELFKSFFY